MNTLKFTRGDEVKIIAGSNKGQTAKVVAVYPRQHSVTLEGIGLVKRKVKPSQANPKGGTKEVHVPIDASKLSLVVIPTNKTTTKQTKPAKEVPATKERSKK